MLIGIMHNPEFRFLPRYTLPALFAALFVGLFVLQVVLQVSWLSLVPILIIGTAAVLGFLTGRFSGNDAAVFLKFAAPGILLPTGMFPLFLPMAAGYVGLALVLMIPLVVVSTVWAWRIKRELDRLRAAS